MGKSVGPLSEHSLRAFLKRPVILFQGTWDQTSIEGTELWGDNFPSALLKDTYIQNVQKVTGFVGMRAKVRVRVQFNSQPFQQGMAILSYLPYAEYMPQHMAWFYKSQPPSAPTTADMCAVSGNPHVLCNLANQTAIEFVTPYISPYIYVNLVTGQGSFGRVTLNSLTPVASAASPAVNFTVWANFEDVELTWPTDAPLTTKWAQVGSELDEMEQTGVISSAVSSFGNIASSILPSIGLSSLAKPVSLFSTTASNVLKLFGFSKPSVQAPVTRVLQAPARYFLNADGSDTSHKLGLSAGNELQTVSGFAGTDHDEMAMSYIAARPTYIDSFKWTLANDDGVALWRKALTPLALGWRGNPSTSRKAVVDRLSPAARLATLMNMWRGDFVFDFHFVKTQMHSGRLLISTRLYNYESNFSVLDTQPGFTETADVDLSTTSTVRYRVPFAAVRPWLLTEVERNTNLTSGDALNYCMGQIQVTVLNPLVAAPQCSTEVTVIVFAHMENAQFAVPTRSTYNPYALPPAVIPFDGEAQVGGVEETREVSEDHLKTPTLMIAPHSMCTGEMVTSVRQLMKRFTKVRTSMGVVLPATANTAGSTGNAFLIRPWRIVSPATATISSTAPPYEPTDYYSHFAPMYSFMRGSMRFKLTMDVLPTTFNTAIPFRVFINTSTINKIASNPTATLGQVGVINQITDVPATAAGNIAYQPGFGDTPVPIYLDKEGSIEFEVPYYSTGHMTCTSYADPLLVDSRTSILPIPRVILTHPQLVGATFTLYRAVGDDFSFGGLLGCPQVCEFNYSTNPTTTP